MGFTTRASIITECKDLTLQRRRADIEATRDYFNQGLISEKEVYTVLKVFAKVTSNRHLNGILTEPEIIQTARYIAETIL